MRCDSLSRCDRLRQISATFTLLMWIAMRRFGQLLQTFGLTPAQFMALFTLTRSSRPRPMSDLTTASLQDAPTMTGIVDRLEKVGLVERTRSDSDRRVVLVQATPAGHDTVRQVQAKLLDDDVAGCAALTDAELAETEHLFRDIFRLHLKRIHLVNDVDVEEAIRAWELSLYASAPDREVVEASGMVLAQPGAVACPLEPCDG
jgi:DNA-binding MarR family transcriptional regulator